MQTISYSAMAQVKGGNATPGYIDATEYAMIKQAWKEHAYAVAHGADIEVCRYLRDTALMLHSACKQY